MVKPSYPGIPLPIGYIEVQRSWVGEKPIEEIREIIAEVMETTQLENPHLRPHGSRVEHASDGAGILHHTLYAGFAPRKPSSEPLDPSNLNDAPLPQPGMIEPKDGILPLGHKEAAFNRGT